ncbi:3'-5' exonuclease [Pseudomonas juntendi]|uniref:3'-5' exonuclease n=2 Tax=Pseudomonas juntendi TaxID=2666183 RepID=UPI003019BD81
MTAMKAANIPCIDIKGNFSIDSEGVRVSTVESAKDFEFGTVFLASTVSEPHATPRADEDSKAGDVVKLYVAMTRARDKLHISYVSNGEMRPVEALGTISSWCDGLKYQDGEVSELLD